RPRPATWRSARSTTGRFGSAPNSPASSSSLVEPISATWRHSIAAARCVPPLGATSIVLFTAESYPVAHPVQHRTIPVTGVAHRAARLAFAPTDPPSLRRTRDPHAGGRRRHRLVDALPLLGLASMVVAARDRLRLRVRTVAALLDP